MESVRAFPTVVDYAFEVIRMQEKIESLESQVEHLLYYRDEYHKMCNDTTKQTDKLFGMMFTASFGDFEAAQAIAES